MTDNKAISLASGTDSFKSHIQNSLVGEFGNHEFLTLLLYHNFTNKLFWINVLNIQYITILLSVYMSL